MTVSQNTLTLSNWLYHAVTAFIVALPLLALFLIGQRVAAPDLITGDFPGIPIASTPSPATIVLAGLMGFLPMAAMIYALVQMRGLFGRYRQGEILTAICALHIKGIGQGLVAGAALGVIANSLQIVILTWANPPGQRVLAIGIETDTIGFLLSGALMILIGRVMAEAARVADENRSFV